MKIICKALLACSLLSASCFSADDGQDGQLDGQPPIQQVVAVQQGGFQPRAWLNQGVHILDQWMSTVAVILCNVPDSFRVVVMPVQGLTPFFAALAVFFTRELEQRNVLNRLGYLQHYILYALSLLAVGVGSIPVQYFCSGRFDSLLPAKDCVAALIEPYVTPLLLSFVWRVLALMHIPEWFVASFPRTVNIYNGGQQNQPGVIVSLLAAIQYFRGPATAQLQPQQPQPQLQQVVDLWKVWFSRQVIYTMLGLLISLVMVLPGQAVGQMLRDHR
ncbi:MAG: hypothetical protein LBF84_00030 [Holosporales bacterium]|nr:hypothetical protein [Holosporales bacterium]